MQRRKRRSCWAATSERKCVLRPWPWMPNCPHTPLLIWGTHSHGCCAGRTNPQQGCWAWVSQLPHLLEGVIKAAAVAGLAHVVGVREDAQEADQGVKLALGREGTGERMKR